LQEIAKSLDFPHIDLVSAKANHSSEQNEDEEKLAQIILQTIKRRPSTIEDLIQTTGAPKVLLQNILNHFLDHKQAQLSIMERGIFYFIAKEPHK
jgi:hypothetical protein